MLENILWSIMSLAMIPVFLWAMNRFDDAMVRRALNHKSKRRA